VIVLISNSNGGFLISKVKQVQGRVFEKLLTEHGVDAFNGAQGRILFVLWGEDGIPISDLSEKTGLAKTTLTGMLDRLEASGHIRREPDPADRRKVFIRLTSAARALQADYDEVSTRMNLLFYNGFTDSEIIIFENALTHILQNLTGKDETV